MSAFNKRRFEHHKEGAQPPGLVPCQLEEVLGLVPPEIGEILVCFLCASAYLAAFFIPQIDDISHKIARRALLIFRIAGAIINGYVAYCSLPRLYTWLDEIHEILRLLNTQLSTLMARMSEPSEAHPQA